jgi:hypothetical protein
MIFAQADFVNVDILGRVASNVASSMHFEAIYYGKRVRGIEPPFRYNAHGQPVSP